MSMPVISYIMFECPGANVFRDYPRWILEIYIEPVDHAEPTIDFINMRNIYCINSLGIIDSLSPSPTSIHEFTESALGYNLGDNLGDNNVGPPAFISHLGQRYYGSQYWVECDNIDNLRFPNLSVQENAKLVEDVRKAITEFYL